MTDSQLTELNRMIAVMEASKTQEIESCNRDGSAPWGYTQGRVMRWNWDDCDYRVRPVEPRRILVSWKDDGSPEGSEWKKTPTLDEACEGHLVEFIELTPEIRAKLNL